MAKWRMVMLNIVVFHPCWMVNPCINYAFLSWILVQHKRVKSVTQALTMYSVFQVLSSVKKFKCNKNIKSVDSHIFSAHRPHPNIQLTYIGYILDSPWPNKISKFWAVDARCFRQLKVTKDTFGNKCGPNSFITCKLWLLDHHLQKCQTKDLYSCMITYCLQYLQIVFCKWSTILKRFCYLKSPVAERSQPSTRIIVSYFSVKCCLTNQLLLRFILKTFLFNQCGRLSNHFANWRK